METVVESAIMPPLSRSALSTRYRSLDLWRGVACLMVVVFHSAFYITENTNGMPTGVAGTTYKIILEMSNGVAMFFVISGYCIAAACDSVRTKPQGARQFFFRRFRRIFPPYWIAMALVLVSAIALLRMGPVSLVTDLVRPIQNPMKLTPAMWFGNLSLTETWRFTICGKRGFLYDGFLLGQAWTLCYEEQFYAVCGLALFLWRRRFFEVLGAITMIVALTGAIQIVLWGRYQIRLPIDGFFFDGRWLTFAAGVLVYYRLVHAKAVKGRLLDLLLILCAIATIAVYRKYPGQMTKEFRTGYVFALAIVFLHRWDRLMSESRLLRPLSICGLMCYSLYLIHGIVAKVISNVLYAGGLHGPWQTLFITIPLCLVGSIGVAWVFFTLVERRFLNTPRAAPRTMDSELRVIKAF